jgi:hypothetical protein
MNDIKTTVVESKPAFTVCGETQLILENMDNHICGLEIGHEGWHVCKLCGYNWIDPNPQPIMDEA